MPFQNYLSIVLRTFLATFKVISNMISERIRLLCAATSQGNALCWWRRGFKWQIGFSLSWNYFFCFADICDKFCFPVKKIEKYIIIQIRFQKGFDSFVQLAAHGEMRCADEGADSSGKAAFLFHALTFFALTTFVTNSCWSKSSFFLFRVIVGLRREAHLAIRMRNVDNKTIVISA